MESEGTRTDRRRRLLCTALLATVTLSVSSWFFVSMGTFTGGRLSFPLDDSYIYFQYARQIAEGNGLSYSPGAGHTTGATSLPYALLLSLGHVLGARGEGVLLLSFFLGACFLFLSALLIARIVEGFSHWIPGTASAVLFLLNGHVLWSYLSGMEVGLFASAILLTLLAFQTERGEGKFYRTAAAAALMGLSRPEGVFLALPVALLVLLLSSERPWPERALTASLCLLGGAQFLVNLAVGGSLASTGAQAKSVFYTQEPDIFHLYMRRFLELPGFVLNLFLTNFYSSSFSASWARVGSLFLKAGFALALTASLLVRRHRNAFSLLLFSWALLSLFLSLVPWAWEVHMHRYQAPFFPVFLVIASLGYGLTARVAAQIERPALRAVSWAALCLVFAVASVSFFGTSRRIARIYAHNCENIFHQQVRVGEWVRANTPADMIVGLNDAGAIAFVGERPVYDFVGIVTPGQARNWRSGIGSIVEALEELPQEKLPQLLAIYPNWLPFLVNSGMAGTEVFRAHLDLNTICGGTDKVVYLPDWSLLGTGHKAPATLVRGLSVVDEVDVADMESEESHEYRVLGTWRSVARVLEDELGRQVLDGGRVVFQGESMTVGCVQGKDLVVIARLDEESGQTKLFADGVLVGSAEAPWGELRWWHTLTRIPGELLRSDSINITVRFTPGPRSRARSYGSYHYWFLQ